MITVTIEMHAGFVSDCKFFLHFLSHPVRFFSALSIACIFPC